MEKNSNNKTFMNNYKKYAKKFKFIMDIKKMLKNKKLNLLLII